MNKFKGSLELNWINKDKSLLYEIDEEEGVGVKPIWVEKDDIRVSEPRVLKLKGEYGDLDNENMLIKGDNLLALRTLVEVFKNREEKDKVKCIYTDPPFNTGSAFEHYDDNLEHSQWLTMMRDRLILLKQLMRRDGAITVHIDYREEARLKLLMDEVFGVNNFRNAIIVKRGTKNVQQQFETIDSLTSGHDVILLYTVNPTTRFPHCRSDLDEIKRGSWNNHWRGTDRPTMRYELFGIKPKKGQWRWSKERTMKAVYNYEIYLKEYSNAVSIDDYYSMRLTEEGIKLDFVRLSKTGKPEHYIPPKSFKIVSDVWMDVRTAGRITDFVHEKHEDLLIRIINWLTSPGDIVLDSFAGSGTTGAVAYKMKRRWIMIEVGNHAETHCLPRIKSIISDDEKTPKKIDGYISRSGGGFRYYEVGESIIKDLDMNWDMTLEEMSRAVFMNFDYSMIEGDTYRLEDSDDEFYLGKQKGGIAICLVTKNIKIIRHAELNKLVKDLSKKYTHQKITIFTNMGVAVKPEEVGEKLDVKKIPESILKKYRMV